MISVCLATYNGEKYIRQQIESILQQLSLDDELVISDDGSIDSTLNIIRSFNYPKIIIHSNSFRSPVRNFEFLINKAKGDYIFLSDQDDIWDAKKIETYKEYFLKLPDVSLIVSDIQIIDKEGFLVDKLFYNNGFKGSLLQNIIVNNFIGCSMAFRRDLLSKVLPFPNKIPMHDWWIGLCAIKFSKVHFIENKYTFYRRHDSNVTKDEGGEILQKLYWRIYLVGMLFKRYLKELL
jgi:glycosyltransferase involved in cell wall biosynthesis